MSAVMAVQTGFVEPVSAPAAFAVQVAADVGSIGLSWQAQYGVRFYRVWCGLSSDSMSLVADSVLGTGYTISGLMPGAQYFVQVTGVRSPRNSIPSLPGDGSGGGVDIGGSGGCAIAVIVPVCWPLAADVCYPLIQAGTAPLTAGTTPDPGFGVEPYLFDFPIDWGSDSSCGWNITVAPGFSLICTIDQNNVPLNRRKQRRVVFRLPQGNAASFVAVSNPAVGGDALPSGTYPAGTVITIDFSSDCAGNVSAQVGVSLPPMTWNPATNTGWTLSNNNLTAAVPVSYQYGSNGCLEIYSPVNVDWGLGTVTASFVSGLPSPFVGGEIRIQFSAVPPPSSTQRVVVSMPAGFPFVPSIVYTDPALGGELTVGSITGGQTVTIDFSTDAAGNVSFVVS